MTVIELKNISFKYEKGDEPVLTDLDLKVEEGTCMAVTGDNGSGKTTLFRIINGLCFPDKGEYLYKGTAITEAYLKDNACAKRFHKEIGYLFQNPDTMLFNSNVYDEVAFGPRQMGLRDEEVEERVRDCLKLFEIEDLADNGAGRALRGTGQQKRGLAGGFPEGTERSRKDPDNSDS